MTDIPSVVKVTTDKTMLPPVIKINNQVFKIRD